MKLHGTGKNPALNFAEKATKAIVKGAAIGLITTVAGFTAYNAYDLSESSALRKALSIEQELALYSSGKDSLKTRITSIFDKQFSFPNPRLKEGNVSFMRDAVLHRHELACGRDQAYAKEFVEKGQTYLGCSIEPVSNADGVFVNTYSIGEKLSASFSVSAYGENKEYRTDLTFPRNFKSQAVGIAGPERALDLARLAVDLQIASRGKIQNFATPQGLTTLKQVLQEGKYLERWVASGGEPRQLWEGLSKLGSLPEPQPGGHDKITSLVHEGTLDREELEIASESQLRTMEKIERKMNKNLAIAAIRNNLDHNCEFRPKKTTARGFADHNNECAQDLGLHRSLQLQTELTSGDKLTIENTVHGTVNNRLLLGSYKGHPVLSELVDTKVEGLAFVRIPGKKYDWTTTFLETVYKEDPLKNQKGEFSSGPQSARALHFNHQYAPHHTPIFVSQHLAEVFNLASLDKESQDLIMEMTLEHEIKHILDVALHRHDGTGTLNKNYDTQQAACDIYAVQVMADKYQDPETLKKLKAALQLRGKGFHDSTEAQKITAIEGANIIKKAAIMALSSHKQDKDKHRGDVVMNYLDKRIAELEGKTGPKKSAAPTM